MSAAESMPRSVSVVTVSYNSRQHLVALKQALSDAMEWIVVDNASSDGSAEEAEALGARVIKMTENLGFGAACNAGAALAEGELLLFLNPDARMKSGTSSKLAEHFSDPGVVAVGPLHREADGRFQPSCGGPVSFRSEWTRKRQQARADRGELQAPASGEYGATWLSGSCLMVRRRAFERVEGFDESFFLYFEDIDLCIRLGAEGKLIYDAAIEVTHDRGTSSGERPAFVSRAYRASQRRFAAKHWERWERLLLEIYLRARGR